MSPQGIPHPTNDPSLVSYHRPELMALMPQLEVAHDCWTLLVGDGTGSAKEKYLHREPAEPRQAYDSRLSRSTFAPIYRDSIKSYAGLLSRFQVFEGPESLEKQKDNVDLQGSSLQSFMSHVDEKAIRDGGAYVMVDMMPETFESNFFDQQTDGRYPYFISIDRCDVINWAVTYDRGIETIEHATIRLLRSIPDPEGKYGRKIEPVYHVLTPGLVEMYLVEKNGPSSWTNRKIGEVQTSLPIVPLVWYGATSTRFAQGDLPMSGLADLSLQHFQMRSDLAELFHKCAMPVPVRKGAPIGPDGQRAPLVLGPNTAVDLGAGPEGGDFFFAEPTGKSLERHQAEITHVEGLMDRSSLNFLYGTSVKTATEASLRASQVAASIQGLVRNKVAAAAVLIRLWAWYAGEQDQITEETGLAMNESLIAKPLEANGIAQLVNLYTNELLSRQTILDELQRGGVLDPDLIIDDELQRLEEEREERKKKELEDAEETLEMDLERAEKFQAIAPNEPGQGSETPTGTPSSGQSSKKKPSRQGERPPASEQEKTRKRASQAQ